MFHCMGTDGLSISTQWPVVCWNHTFCLSFQLLYLCCLTNLMILSQGQGSWSSLFCRSHGLHQQMGFAQLSWSWMCCHVCGYWRCIFNPLHLLVISKPVGVSKEHLKLAYMSEQLRLTQQLRFFIWFDYFAFLRLSESGELFDTVVQSTVTVKYCNWLVDMF